MGSAPPGTPLRGLLHNHKGRHRGTQYRSAGHPAENIHCATSKRPMHWLKNISNDEIFVLLGRSVVTDVSGQPIDLFWDVTKRRSVVTDVSEQPIDLFWDVTKRRSVVSYRRFGTIY